MIESNKTFLLDSNILVYAYEQEQSQRKKLSEKMILDCYIGKNSIALSNQNLAEFISVSTSKGKLGFGEARNIVADILTFSGFIKLNYSATTLLSALTIAHTYAVPFWDALLIATMQENNISTIYTENIKDFKVPGIQAINPFA